MSNQEVIDLVDSDGDDTVEVISEHYNTQGNDHSLINLAAQNSRDTFIRQGGDSRRVHWQDQRDNGAQGNQRNDYNDDDDDVEIVEERINVPERPSRSPTPSFLIHVPGGPIPNYSNENSAEPERRSFQNAQGPDTGLHYRAPIIPASSDEVLRDRQRQGHMRHEMVLRNQRQNTRGRGRGRNNQRYPTQGRFNNYNNHNNHNDQYMQNIDYPMLWMRQNFGNLFYGDQDEDDDPTYHPGMQFPPFMPHVMGGHHGGGPQGDNQVDQHIMNLIEQRESQEADKKRSINSNATKQTESICLKKIETIKTPYSNRLDPEEEYVCILCGVTLGEGIPVDFSGNKTEIKLPILQEQNDVPAPYQANNLITDADRDLSKRIFMSTCGHTYCGRCVKNINRVKDILKQEKRLKHNWKKTNQDIKNPLLYAPAKCVGDDCNVGLCAKRRFTEVYI